MTLREGLLSIYMLILLGILLWGARFAGRKKFHEDFLSVDVSKGLQGITALAIMFHHIVQRLCKVGIIYPTLDQGPVTVFNDYGVLLTAVFFFFSGFGLYVGFVEKPNYLKHFLRKRLSTVLVPFIIINFIFVAYYIYIGMRPSALYLLEYLTGWVLLNGNLWFIVEIAVLYLAFFLFFKFIKNKNLALIFMGVFVIALIIMSLLLGHDHKTISGGSWFHGEWWYNTTLTFYIGMLIAKFRANILPTVKKYYYLFLSISIVLFAMTYHLTMIYMEKYGYYVE